MVFSSKEVMKLECARHEGKQKKGGYFVSTWGLLWGEEVRRPNKMKREMVWGEGEPRRLFHGIEWHKYRGKMSRCLKACFRGAEIARR